MVCRFTIIRRLTSRIKGPRARQERFRAAFCRLSYETLVELDRKNMQKVAEQSRWKKAKASVAVTRDAPRVVEMDAWRKPR